MQLAGALAETAIQSDNGTCFMTALDLALRSRTSEESAAWELMYK
jgi:hypothetical protein